MLYSIRQASTTTWASSSVAKSSILNSSSRTRLLNDSTKGFSQGEPGSMKAVLVPGQSAVVAQRPRDHLRAVVHP